MFIVFFIPSYFALLYFAYFGREKITNLILLEWQVGRWKRGEGLSTIGEGKEGGKERYRLYKLRSIQVRID